MMTDGLLHSHVVMKEIQPLTISRGKLKIILKVLTRYYKSQQQH